MAVDCGETAPDLDMVKGLDRQIGALKESHKRKLAELEAGEYRGPPERPEPPTIRDS